VNTLVILFPLVTHCLSVGADWDWIFMCMVTVWSEWMRK